MQNSRLLLLILLLLAGAVLALATPQPVTYIERQKALSRRVHRFDFQGSTTAMAAAAAGAVELTWPMAAVACAEPRSRPRQATTSLREEYVP
jgi:hypothetical protein|tara:strand:- start:9 stop:284 length:276 start_codon:yes stop_codon:yes gene_type:complete